MQENSSKLIAKKLLKDWNLCPREITRQKKKQVLRVCYFKNLLSKTNVQITRTIVLKLQAY